MTLEEEINKDNCWKELVKKMIEKNNNFNDFTKELLKFAADIKHEENKNRIITNYKIREAIDQNQTKQ